MGNPNVKQIPSSSLLVFNSLKMSRKSLEPKLCMKGMDPKTKKFMPAFFEFFFKLDFLEVVFPEASTAIIECNRVAMQ